MKSLILLMLFCFGFGLVQNAEAKWVDDVGIEKVSVKADTLVQAPVYVVVVDTAIVGDYLRQEITVNGGHIEPKLVMKNEDYLVNSKLHIDPGWCGKKG